MASIEELSANLRQECERRGIPVRIDGVITASGLAQLLSYSRDTVDKWRAFGGGPAYRIASWRGHRYTYRLSDIAEWLESGQNRREPTPPGVTNPRPAVVGE